MVGTILPIVYGKRQQQSKFDPAVVMYTVGCLIGAAGLGLTLGVIGTALPAAINHGFFSLVSVGIVSLVYSTRELGFFRIPAPQCSWQVPSSWRAVYSANTAALFYGVGLGFGVTTRIPTTAFYPVVVWALLISNPLLAMSGMAAFGLGRALPVIHMSVRKMNTEESFGLVDELAYWKPAVHLTNGLILGSAGSALFVSGLVALR